MLEERKLLAGGEIKKVFIHQERRNSVRVTLGRKGIIVRVPRHLSSIQKEKEIDQMLEWAKKRLTQDPEHRYKKKNYYHGHYLKTNSKIYQLHIETKNKTKNYSKIQGNTIRFKLSNEKTEEEKQEYISKSIRKLLAKHHQQELIERIHKINKENFGKEIGPIKYKYTTSRWGVCKLENKEINLSTKLLLAPLPVQEYVIIHELAHLIEANHSRRFWNIVKSVDEHYKEKIRWLKQYGHTLDI